MESDAPNETAMTADDLRGQVTQSNRSELTRGQRVNAPPADSQRAVIVATLQQRLQAYLARTGAGRIFAGDLGFVLRRDPDTVRIPDVAFVRRHRCKHMAESDDLYEGTPDLAVVLMAPNAPEGDLEDRLQDYLRARTPLIWVVNAELQSVVVHRHGDRRALFRGDTIESDELFPGFFLPVIDVFRQSRAQ